TGARITLYDTAAGRELGKLEKVVGKPFDSLRFSPDSRTIVGYITPLVNQPGSKGSPSRSLFYVWEAVTGKLRATISDATGPPAFSSDSRTVTMADTTKAVAQRWDVSTAKLLATFTLPQKLATELGKPRMTPDGKTTLGPG